jgi:hypothetical protein
MYFRSFVFVLRLVLICVVPAAALAQEPGSPPGHEGHTVPQDPHAGHEAAAPQDQHAGHDPAAPATFAPREASGTAWLPDATPMYGYHRPARGWDVMLHGNGFLQFLYEGGEEHRTGNQAGSINWFMAMARRPVGAGRVGLRGMVSLEPFTIGGCGYPDLLATGETCDGDSIHDRQHPHDLFMELALEYDRPLTRGLRWQLYGGPAGEPALGPAAFPHRPSAMPNPVAPIGHHWFDATHITYGVVTGSVYARRWKVEASAFNGREPDEERRDLDFAPLASYSGRVALMPAAQVAVQISAGHLADAEAAHGAGRQDVERATASVVYHRQNGPALWATMAAWGVNREPTDTTHAFLVESSLTPNGLDTWFGRVEVAGKPAHSLHVHESEEVFTVGKLQAGYVRYFPSRGGVQPGIGGSVSASLLPAPLRARYGGAVVPGFSVFFTVRPVAHRM